MIGAFFEQLKNEQISHDYFLEIKSLKKIGYIFQKKQDEISKCLEVADIVDVVGPD